MRIYNIFGRLARTHYRNRATASTACTPNATCCSIYLPFPHKYHGCSPLIAYAQLHLTANGSIPPQRSTKRPNVSPSESTFSPPSYGDARLDCGTVSQNSPTFSEKRGGISKKSPIFYFASPATRSKQPRKVGNSPQSHSHPDHFKQNTPSIKQKPAEFTKIISHITSNSHPTNTKLPCISSFMGESFALRPKIIIFADISEQRSREAVLVPLTTRTL